MKKFITLIVAVLSLLCFTACKKQASLTEYVSELRSDVFYGQSKSFTVKGGYGFNETPYVNDGTVGSKAYFLTLKLVGQQTSQSAFTASIIFNEQKYSAPFKLNPVTHSLVANIELEGFDLKEFSIDISCGDNTESVTLKSQVPLDTITYSQALDYLEKAQPQLIKAFSDGDGNFNAEIHARIIVKNQKAYWYVGLAGGNDLLKALLIDGLTGEVLAIREII